MITSKNWYSPRKIVTNSYKHQNKRIVNRKSGSLGPQSLFEPGFFDRGLFSMSFFPGQSVYTRFAEICHGLGFVHTPIAPGIPGAIGVLSRGEKVGPD
jgi:hypothetical protein